jgi:hypothetical protein
MFKSGILKNDYIWWLFLKAGAVMQRNFPVFDKMVTASDGKIEMIVLRDENEELMNLF